MHPALPWAVLAAPAALPAAITAINALTWARGRPAAMTLGGPRISVLIPARDEAATIEGAARAALAASDRVLEVIVYNDGSTDQTGSLLAAIAVDHPRLKVMNGDGLPDGWVGKPHACHRLAQEAEGDLLLYLDADVTLAPGGLERLLELIDRPTARGDRPALVTAVPQQLMGSLGERVLMPMLMLTYTSWLPLALIPISRDPRVLAANGQVLMVRRAALQAAGGWEAVRHEIVDDMALCKRVKQTGGAVVFADGHHIAQCRMYTSGAELWAGFSKNLYEGIGGHPLALAAVVALYGACFVLPWVALPIALAAGAPVWATAAAVGVGLNLLTRLILAERHAHGLLAVALHPLAVLGLLGIAANSMRWSRRGAIEWAGRTYAARSQRGSP